MIGIYDLENTSSSVLETRVPKLNRRLTQGPGSVVNGWPFYKQNGFIFFNLDPGLTILHFSRFTIPCRLVVIARTLYWILQVFFDWNDLTILKVWRHGCNNKVLLNVVYLVSRVKFKIYISWTFSVTNSLNVNSHTPRSKDRITKSRYSSANEVSILQTFKNEPRKNFSTASRNLSIPHGRFVERIVEVNIDFKAQESKVQKMEALHVLYRFVDI